VFATQLLAAKIMRKVHYNQVAAHFIELGSQCSQGTIYNWEAFLQNEFVEDCREAQEKGTLFHYAWLLILIALEAWRALTSAKFLKVISHECRAVRYINLAWRNNRQQQLITDQIFIGYFEQIVTTISDIPRVPIEIIDEYRLQVMFKVDMHYVSVCIRWDPNKTWVLGHVQITLQEVEAIMTDWEEGWKKDVQLDEVSGSEDEETETDKKYEQEEVEEFFEKNKPATKKTKKTMTKNKNTIETIEDQENIEQTTVLVMTEETGKQKIVLGGAGSTPKKARGTLVKFPQIEYHITLLAEKRKDHSVTVWEDIDNTKQEMLTGVAERVAKL